MEKNDDDDKDLVAEPCLPVPPSLFLACNSEKFVDDVFNGPSESFLENFRMDKFVFNKLSNILQSRGLLRHTNRIKIEEQLAIFMYIVGHNLRTRTVQESFKYSSETISRHFNSVLNAIVSISRDLFPPQGSNTPPEIQKDFRFFPYFKDCVGAVDGVHFPVIVGVDEQGPFRNKNGSLSQIVLAACSFDMKFHYVLAGWEGSAADMHVLNAALTRRNKLQVPKGKYYLVDLKYADMPGCIAPYPDARYESLEESDCIPPKDAKELFNLRHLTLQKITQRTFAALKARFPVLMALTPYPLPTQVKLVVAACTMHNFICTEQPDDWILKSYAQEGDFPLENELENNLTQIDLPDIPFDTEELEHISRLRDFIASEMWNDYARDCSTIRAK